MKKPQFTRIAKSKSFRNRAQAEEWADEQKRDYGLQGISVRKEITQDDTTSRWKAVIKVKMTGKRSLEE